MNGTRDQAIPLLNEDAPEVLGNVEEQQKKRSNIQKLFYLFIAIFALICILGGLFLFKMRMSGADEDQIQQKPEQKIPSYMENNQKVENKSIFQIKQDIVEKQEQERERIAKVLAEQEAMRLRAEGMSNTLPNTTSRSIQTTKHSGNMVQSEVFDPVDRKLTGDVLFEPTGSSENISVTSINPNITEKAPKKVSHDVNQTSLIAESLKPTILAGRSAGKLSNLDFLLKQGTSIPCALKTGIDTTLPGFSVCNVTRDVYSANAKTLLIRRGAEIFGEQRSNLKHGQARVFMLFSRIDNPDGTFAQLDSPATDVMGLSGVSGFVDSHFKERFGAAFLISMIEDVAAYATQQAANSNGRVTFENTADEGSRLGQEILKNSINIPPTLIVNPGTVINVLVARDVSFESVYQIIN